MKPFLWSPIVLTMPVLACTSEETKVGQAVAEVNEASTSVTPSSDAEADLYFPVENYRKYPRQVRELIRRNEIENDQCRGIGEGREKYRACNRRHRLLVELERRGWCWGQGAVKLHISANNHWLPCSDDPTYRPGRLREIPFPEAE